MTAVVDRHACAASTVHSLGDELLCQVLYLLAPPALAAAELTCTHWLQLSTAHQLWKRHAEDAGFHDSTVEAEGSGPSSESVTDWKVVCLQLTWVRAFASNRPHALRSLSAHAGKVTCCSTLGGLLVTASEDQTAKVWQLPQVDPLATLPHRRGESALFCKILNPHLLVTATSAAGYVWALATVEAAAAPSSGPFSQPTLQPRLIRRFGSDSPGVASAAAWDSTLALGRCDGSVALYDLYSGSMTALLREHEHAVTALHYAVHDGLDLLLSGDASGAVVVAHPLTALALARTSAPPRHSVAGATEVTALAWTGRGFLAAIGGSGWVATGRTLPLPEDMAVGVRSAVCWWLEPQALGSDLASTTICFTVPRYGPTLLVGACGRATEGGEAAMAPVGWNPNRAPAEGSRNLGSVPRLPMGSTSGAGLWRCTCLSADAMPVVAGYADGTVALWRW